MTCICFPDSCAKGNTRILCRSTVQVRTYARARVDALEHASVDVSVGVDASAMFANVARACGLQVVPSCVHSFAYKFCVIPVLRTYFNPDNIKSF